MLMKTLLAATCLTALTATSALAQDWSGAYGGLTVGKGDADVRAFFGFDLNFEYEGDAYGLFAGYNVQNGNIVYGGELAVQSANLSQGSAVESIDRLIDLKGRLGYSFGNALVYGVAGFSQNRAATTSSDAHSTGDGYSYGLGAEVKLGERMFVGAEYLMRRMSNPENLPLLEFLDNDISTLSLRVGMQF